MYRPSENIKVKQLMKYCVYHTNQKTRGLLKNLKVTPACYYEMKEKKLKKTRHRKLVKRLFTLAKACYYLSNNEKLSPSGINKVLGTYILCSNFFPVTHRYPIYDTIDDLGKNDLVLLRTIKARKMEIFSYTVIEPEDVNYFKYLLEFPQELIKQSEDNNLVNLPIGQGNILGEMSGR